MKYAPIALFVFNRPDHTKKTINALKDNPEFLESQFFVFCDGPRLEQDESYVREVREVVKAFALPNLTLIERDKNMGLASSVVTGVTDLCKQFDRVIVLEDDLIVSREFLSYMNNALNRYEDEERVMQISGYMFPIETGNNLEASLLPITSTWGWATWKRAWDKYDPTLIYKSNFLSNRKERKLFNLDNSYPYTRRLNRQRRGLSDSWGIQWYISVFMMKGLVLYPPKSLVINSGFDGSGTHCGIEEDKNCTLGFEYIGLVKFPALNLIDENLFGEVKKHLQKNNRLFDRFFIKIQRFIKILKNLLWNI